MDFIETEMMNASSVVTIDIKNLHYIEQLSVTRDGDRILQLYREMRQFVEINQVLYHPNTSQVYQN